MKKIFYITTPIYYPSGSLHIGHAYTTSVADSIARYKRLRGYDVFFLTGSDEHGQKIEARAKDEGLTPMEFVNRIVPTFIALWERLGISYDKFIRTTDEYHVEAVQKIFSRYLNQGDVYMGSWLGLYCVSCEENYTEKRAVRKGEDLYCVHGHKLEQRNEDSYFFKMTKYSDWLRQHMADHQDFILPKHRVNEMVKNFLDEDLTDLSVSRTTFSWGVNVLENPRHVIYVWIDALSNYITALGYLQKNHSNFDKYWSEEAEILQIVGKEITRFHTIYWPIMLKALGLRAPTTVFAHGWITNKEGKMSKSLGNVVDPNRLLDKYGRDAVRYYFLRSIPLGSDGQYTEESFLECYNAFLANIYGNLVHRTASMIVKYFGGAIPAFKGFADVRQEQICQAIVSAVSNYERAFDAFETSAAILAVDPVLANANKFIEDIKPWELAKQGKNEELANALGLVVHSIRVASVLLSPVLCDAALKVKEIFSFSDFLTSYESVGIYASDLGSIKLAAPIFARMLETNI